MTIDLTDIADTIAEKEEMIAMEKLLKIKPKLIETEDSFFYETNGNPITEKEWVYFLKYMLGERK